MNPSDTLFQGNSEMTLRCRQLDWFRTSLGPVSLWGQSLRTASQLVLASPFPNILLWGAELIQIYNDEYCYLMGNNHPAGLGQPTQQCWPEVWHINQPIYQRVWAGESVAFQDALFPITRSGQLEEAWFTLAYSPVRNESDQVGGILVTVFETTSRIWEQQHRQQLQQALQQREQRQALLLNLSDTLRPLTDATEIQTTVSDAALTYFGADRCYYCEITEGQAIIRQDANRAGLPSVAGTYPLNRFPLLQAVIDAGRPFVVSDIHSTNLVDEPLRQLCVQLQVISFVDVPVIKKGQPVGVLCITQCTPRAWEELDVQLAQEIADRTWAAVERTRIEEAQRHSEERLRLFVQASSDIVYQMSADWVQMKYLVGKNFLVDAQTPTHSWLETYIPLQDQSAVKAMIQQAITSKSLFELEHQVIQADGRLGWTFSRAIPVLNKEGDIQEWFGTASNITDRKQAQVALEEADRRKDEFLAMLAHELRNPLAPIRNGLQVLTTTEPTEPTLNALLPIMNRQMDHLMRMVDDLLDVSRISRGRIELRKQRMDLTQMVAQVIDAMRPLFPPSNRQLTTHLPDYPLYVDGDATRLNQVVTNLLNNGLRYTHEGGQVWLTLERHGQQALLRVRDNGIGLAADQLKAVFGLFVQMDKSLARSYGGLGLGLSLVQELIQRHGGQVEAQSPGLEQGSEFIVTLPLLLTDHE